MRKLKDAIIVIAILALMYFCVVGLGDRDGGTDEVDAKMEQGLYEKQIYEEGKDDGYHFGYQAGYDEGFNDGLEMGYEYGYEACMEEYGLNG